MFKYIYVYNIYSYSGELVKKTNYKKKTSIDQLQSLYKSLLPKLGYEQAKKKIYI